MLKKIVENFKQRKKPISKKRVHFHRFIPSAILNIGKIVKRDMSKATEMSGLSNHLTLNKDPFR